jgi:DNA-binding NarL/FixJ family response regulator
VPTSRLIVCDAQPIVVEGLRRLLEATPEIELAGMADSLEAALAGMESARPDAVLIDHDFGLSANVRFRAEAARVTPGVLVLIWGARIDPVAARSYSEAGLAGVADKTWPAGDLREWLLALMDGRPWSRPSPPEAAPAHRRLTPRELEIARLVCQGLNNRQVAESLMITAGTVKVHLMHVFEKTGARDRFELALHRWRFQPSEVGR